MGIALRRIESQHSILAVANTIAVVISQGVHLARAHNIQDAVGREGQIHGRLETLGENVAVIASAIVVSIRKYLDAIRFRTVIASRRIVGM